MVASINIWFFALIFAVIGCGGGGGKYYPPEVSVNRIGIVKEEVSENNINIKSKLIADISLEEIDQKSGNEKKISGVEYSAYDAFEFSNNHYILGISHSNYISIINSEKKTKKKLDIPRYPLKAVALELVGRKNNKRYLAIYIQQQTTSHSSTLYILDKDFNVVYKEHLLGALWMGREPTERGDNLIVSAETKWMPKGKWISVGGPWKYIIFK